MHNIQKRLDLAAKSSGTRAALGAPMRLLVLTFIGLTACGGAEAAVMDGRPAESSPEPAPESGTATRDPSAGERTTLVFHNTMASTRAIAIDAQQTPLDLRIGTPPLQLNGYGRYFCGGDPKDGTSHNDPSFRFVQVEPGARVRVSWEPIRVTLEGNCWRASKLAPGSYAIEVCTFETYAPERTMNETPEGLTCVSRTLTLPEAGGDVVIDI